MPPFVKQSSHRVRAAVWLLAWLSISAPATAQLAPCSAAPAAAAASATTTVPIEVLNNHVYVRVCVKGRELQFILDTGSSGSPIDMNTANEMGIALQGRGVARGAGPGTATTARIDNVDATTPGTAVVVPHRAAFFSCRPRSRFSSVDTCL